jgi:hypothetical protein
LFGPAGLYKVNVGGLTKALSTSKDIEMDSVRVRVVIHLDKSGLIKVKDATATYQLKSAKEPGMMGKDFNPLKF